MKRAELEVKQYPFLPQGLYKAKLSNGLTVHLLPKGRLPRNLWSSDGFLWLSESNF